MKFLLISLGTRGDIEPFLAMGNLLARNGHEVACCFPEQFAHLSEQEGFEFFSLGTEFLELIESEAGKSIMGGIRTSSWKRLYYLYGLYKDSLAINRKMYDIQRDVIDSFKPSQIIFHPKTLYSFTLSRVPKSILSPIPCLIHEVKDRPPAGINFNWGKRVNRLLYKLTIMGIRKNIAQVSMEYLSEEHITAKDLTANIIGTDILYMISPSLFVRPDYWPSNAQVFGYLERDKTIEWSPSEELLQFIDLNKKSVLLTFGSMINGKPEEVTKMFLEVLEANNIPAIINTSFGGLTEPATYNRGLFHFVSDIPYNWIFPHVYGVIHHGGSGTSHMVAKYGCASLIIPHIIDQFMWNSILADQGLGPKGISIRKLKHATLERLITDFYTNEKYKEKSIEICKRMQSENFETEILSFLIKQPTHTFMF